MIVPIRRSWYYSLVNLANADTIVKELHNLYCSDKSIFTSDHTLYKNVHWDYAKEYLPSLSSLFTESGILHKVDRVLLSNTLYFGSLNIIHVDTYNPVFTQYSLNFPVVNCKDSFTAFFKYDGNEVHLSGNPNYDKHYAYVNSATEVHRVETTNISLINTTQLHCGISSNSNRVIASIRFKWYDMPTKKELLTLGVINPFIQGAVNAV